MENYVYISACSWHFSSADLSVFAVEIIECSFPKASSLPHSDSGTRRRPVSLWTGRRGGCVSAQVGAHLWDGRRACRHTQRMLLAVSEPLPPGVFGTLLSFKWYQSKQDATCRMKLLEPFPE